MLLCKVIVYEMDIDLFRERGDKKKQDIDNKGGWMGIIYTNLNLLTRR